MPDRHTLQGQELLDDAMASIVASLGQEGDAGIARAFAQLVLGAIPPRDLDLFTAQAAGNLALAAWQTARERMPGTANVLVFDGSQQRIAFGGTEHTLAVIVNDDMPFLVDSTTEELVRRGLSIHLLIHPVLTMDRDGDGRIVSVSADAKSGQRESVIMVAFDQQIDPAKLDSIRTSLEAVHADVRAAVRDWRPMLAKAWEAVGEIVRAPASMGQDEVPEAQTFLEWLIKDRFTFLGYREYRFVGDDEADRELVIVPDAGLGLLRDPSISILQGMRNFQSLPAVIQQFMLVPRPIMVTRSNRRSTVHRGVPMDVILVKSFGDRGEVTGERMFCGLFTSVALAARAEETPLLRRKVRRVLDQAGFDPKGHDGKSLLHILENLPRHELYQTDDEQLQTLALGVLHLQERQRTALFVHRDPFERFVSCLVYVSRDRYDTHTRRRFQTILELAFNGTESSFNVQLGDDPLARIHFVIQTEPGSIPDHDLRTIEADLIAASRSWVDKLRDALVSRHGEAVGLELLARHTGTFPLAYFDEPDAELMAAEDIRLYEQAAQTGMPQGLLHTTAWGGLGIRILNPGGPMRLSKILPVLANFGLPVAQEVGPFELRAPDGPIISMQDFISSTPASADIAVASASDALMDAFIAVWDGRAGDDTLNRLVLSAGIGWREVSVIRAYVRYMRQIRFPYSQEFLTDTLADHPDYVRDIVNLFHDLHDPDGAPVSPERMAAWDERLDAYLTKVQSLEEDRVLRRLRNIVMATLRTNHFQPGPNGPKPYLALKLDSRAIDGLPKPRPLVEIFVYNQSVEAIHLRGGRIARGGIRWSDRREDFRTEILGLMRTQMVKNTVIVPVGSKGGFVVKRPPPAAAGRDALQQEAIACYRTMMSGLLDVTDNFAADGSVIPPASVVRRDGDDPYLVVAADKGTATFSDIANEISQRYGFWLDDAFASGGSAGYDHKKMGITARGAWESVKRHFREMGTDIQSQDFNVVGVGDMSGDVFGNGMLLSKHIRLIAAFDHRHIFLDPDPAPSSSWEERYRLFHLPRSSWADYDRGRLSPGGLIVERSVKEVVLTPQIKSALGIEDDRLAPADLIRVILSAPADLLWFGGIGTYVRAEIEADGDAGDKANDPLRITARDVRAKVIGEGANLALTQRARIEATSRGVRLNTDFIDNSAGVDTSDHEVNIKILLGDAIAKGRLAASDRDDLLAQMTDEVAALVLRDNYLQTQAITLEEMTSSAGLEGHQRLLRNLERTVRLDRSIEVLPSDAELAARRQAGLGLLRPEIAVLLSYSKMWLYERLLGSDLPDDPALLGDLVGYFPTPLRTRFAQEIESHRLRREIVATVLANETVNRMGPGFVHEAMTTSGMGAADTVRAFIIVRTVYGLSDLWSRIEALDNQIAAAIQGRMLLESRALAARACAWFLAQGTVDISTALARYGDGVRAVAQGLADSLPAEDHDALQARGDELIAQGVAPDLALRVASLPALAAALDVTRIADQAGRGVADVAMAYFTVGHRFGLEWLRSKALSMPTTTHWQRQAVAAALDDLFSHQGDITRRALEHLGSEADPVTAVDAFAERMRIPAGRVAELLSELRMAPAIDISMLTIAGRQLRGLAVG